jgi:hypothetical protein
MFDVVSCTREEVIDAYDVGAIFHESIAKMRAEESCAPRRVCIRIRGKSYFPARKKIGAWSSHARCEPEIRTLSDGSGTVVLEAFSRGVPVITTPDVGASQLVEHGKMGSSCSPGDAAALTDSWCLDNREAIYRMRFAVLETARRRLSRDYRRMLIGKVPRGLNAAGYALGPRPPGSGVSA